MDVILNIVPRNPIQAMADGNMLQIIIFALFLGIAISLVGKKAAAVKSFFDGFAEIMYKINGLVMQVAPYGVFALIVPVVAANGPAVLLPLAKVIAVMYLATVVHALIVYTLVIDRVLDMARTTLNITGDATAAVFIDATEKKYADIDLEPEPAA